MAKSSPNVSTSLWRSIPPDKSSVWVCGLAQSESASFWLQVFTELRNRGLKDILIATTWGGLTGFAEALHAAFPQCMHQTCIVHLLRNSMALVPHKDRKAVARDFKLVYTAATEEEVLGECWARPEETWNKTYPALTQSWHNNWLKVVLMFRFMPELRRLIYTSNPIESVNRGLRTSVKTRTIFPSDEAVFKLMFLTMQRLEAKWTMPISPVGKCSPSTRYPFSRKTSKFYVALLKLRKDACVQIPSLL